MSSIITPVLGVYHNLIARITQTRCNYPPPSHFGTYQSCYRCRLHGWLGNVSFRSGKPSQDLEFDRAVLSLVCFLISLGVQIAISDLQILLTSGQTETDVPVVPAPNSTLNIFQLAVFMLAIVWSSCYVVMIHLQIRRCKSST
jgi:hypothetical protein